MVADTSVRIPLGKSGLFAVIDEADAEQVLAHSWCLTLGGAGQPYAHGRVDGRNQKLHRFIMEAPPHLWVDHRDDDGLNNRRYNLRLCTPRQNCRYTCKRPGSSSFKGVNFQNGRWVARIRDGKRKLHLGSFSNEIDAAIAYDRAAAELFGEFAKLNFPLTPTRLIQGVSPCPSIES